jgi:hypothetical protein
MAQTIKLKRTGIAGKTPIFNEDIVTGEMALNSADGRVFIANSNRVVPIVTTGNVVTGSITISGSFITRRKGFVSSSGALFASLSLSSAATHKTVMYNTSTGKFFYTGSYGGGGGGGGGGLTGTNRHIVFFDGDDNPVGDATLTFDRASNLFSIPNNDFLFPVGNIYTTPGIERGGSLVHGGRNLPTIVNASYGPTKRINLIGLTSQCDLWTTFTSENPEIAPPIGNGVADVLSGAQTPYLPPWANITGNAVTMNAPLYTANAYLIPYNNGSVTFHMKPPPATPGPVGPAPNDTTIGGMILDNDDGTVAINPGYGIMLFNSNTTKNNFDSTGSLVIAPASASIIIGLSEDSASLSIKVRSKKGSALTTLDALYISQSNGTLKLGINTDDPKTAFDIKDVKGDGSGTELVLKVSRPDKGASVADTAGKINFLIDSASYKDYSTSASIASIEADVTAVTATGAAGKLVFKTADQNSTKGEPIEVFRLQKNGGDVTNTVAVVTGRLETTSGVVAGADLETSANVLANSGYVRANSLRIGTATDPGATNALIQGKLRVSGQITGSGNAKFSNNVDIDGILSLGGFTNVSASLAAAVAGGDNLGNHTATQNLNMGGFAITSVGNVDGVDVSVLKTDFDTLKGKTLISGSSQITRLTNVSQITGSNSAAVRIGTYNFGYELIPSTFPITGSGIIIRNTGLLANNYPMLKVGNVELLDINSAITPNTFLINNVDTILITSGSEPYDIYNPSKLIEHTGTQFNIYTGKTGGTNTARLTISSGSTAVQNNFSVGSFTSLKATQAPSTLQFIPVFEGAPNIIPQRIYYAHASSSIFGGQSPQYIVTQPSGSTAGVYGTGARILRDRVTGASLTAGKVYYLDNDSWTLATNADSGASRLLTICTTTTNGSKMLLEGAINIVNPIAGDGGVPLYLSTSGDVTDTPPSTSGAYVRVIGYILQDGGEIYFNPSMEWTIIA